MINFLSSSHVAISDPYCSNFQKVFAYSAVISSTLSIASTIFAFGNLLAAGEGILEGEMYFSSYRRTLYIHKCYKCSCLCIDGF